MAGCKDMNLSNPDFKNPKNILAALLSLFKVPPSISSVMSSPLILASQNTRPGLSPTKIASRIIQRASEAGVPVGPLPNGSVNPGEILEFIRIDEITKAIVAEMAIDIAIQPGTTLQGSGTSTTGPVPVLGTIVGIATGAGTAR